MGRRPRAAGVLLSRGLARPSRRSPRHRSPPRPAGRLPGTDRHQWPERPTVVRFAPTAASSSARRAASSRSSTRCPTRPRRSSPTCGPMSTTSGIAACWGWPWPRVSRATLVYVLYAYDHILGDAPAAAPDGATSAPARRRRPATAASISGRLSRLQASGNAMTGASMCSSRTGASSTRATRPARSRSGPTARSTSSGGDGASFNFADYGQDGSPLNPCGDPPAPLGGHQTPPTAEGGALRSQDLRTSGDPTGLDGAILRVDPATGAGMPGNPFATSPTRTPAGSSATAFGTRSGSPSAPAPTRSGSATSAGRPGRSSTGS